jgi:hypothetical protein
MEQGIQKYPKYFDDGLERLLRIDLSSDKERNAIPVDPCPFP